MKIPRALATLMILSVAWLTAWSGFQTLENLPSTPLLMGSYRLAISAPLPKGIPLATAAPGDEPTILTNSPYPYPYPYRTPSPNFPIVLGAAAIVMIILAAWWIAGRRPVIKE